jgi:hypothetical protein
VPASTVTAALAEMREAHCASCELRVDGAAECGCVIERACRESEPGIVAA